ncbi:MAG: acetylxylan esterase [Clostridia bacterium]|nr:acetylxylan esterase [Clostridia bacterium]
MELHKVYPDYPSSDEIDRWADGIWESANQMKMEVEGLPDPGWRGNFGTFHAPTQIVHFMPEGLHDFYGVLIRPLSGPAPLVVHLPGYGSELSVHPDVGAQGYAVLQLSPMGHWTPNGYDESLKDPETHDWPPLPYTLDSGAEHGYRDWLLCAVMAVLWTWKLDCVIPGRVSFYGTSQGGGTSLLLGSLFRDHGVRCVAADEPFLVDYPLADMRGAYWLLKSRMDRIPEQELGKAWHTLGFADALAHAYRLTCPVLLSGGGADTVCPPETIRKLFEYLPSTKSYTFYEGRQHGYSAPFIQLILGWFRAYA